MGISTTEKKLNFVQTLLCFQCGHFGRFEVYMTYTYFSLFFIPLFKWNKHFYVKSTCCNSLYTIDPSLGHRILHGEPVTLQKEDLTPCHNEQRNNSGRCAVCGQPVEEGFQFCPKCGTKL